MQTLRMGVFLRQRGCTVPMSIASFPRHAEASLSATLCSIPMFIDVHCLHWLSKAACVLHAYDNAGLMADNKLPTDSVKTLSKASVEGALIRKHAALSVLFFGLL